MMATAERQSSPDAIFEVAMGFMGSKHLFVANEIGLFSVLAEGPATLEEIAERAAVPARTIRIIADAMVALGFLNALSYPAWLGLERAVRTDELAGAALTEEQQTIFSEGVEAFSSGAAH